MSIYDFLAKFIFYIIPGIIAWLCYYYLTGTKETSELFNIIYTFVFSTVSFEVGNIVLLAINYISNYNFKITAVTGILHEDNTVISSATFILACIFGIFIGVIFAIISNKNLIFCLANKARITNRVDNFDLWDDLFNDQPWILYRDHITVNTYYGCVIKASDRRNLREVILENVLVTSPSGSEEYRMRNVYLARNPSEFTIEIADYTQEDNGNDKKTR